MEEAEEFGEQNAWRLLHRSVVDDQRTTVRCLPVQGKGVLMQTARQERDGDSAWSLHEYDVPVLVDGVLVMEYVTIVKSELVDGAGNPASVTHKCLGRELVTADYAKKKFQPKSKKGNGRAGPYDHLDIRAGVVLTMQAEPAPGAETQPPAA